jgi:orotidine-5'-phosphate decarboxylase
MSLGLRHGIICATDLDDLQAIARLVEAIDPVGAMVGYKFGSVLALRFGLATVVKTFRGLTAKWLIYDHQKAGLDIPSMAPQFAAVCRDAGMDALILFPVAGPGSVDAFVGATLHAGLVPIVGGALPLPDYLAPGGGFVAEDALPRILDRAWALGARDFIIPATDTPAIRTHAAKFTARPGTRLFMPGIGPLGGEITGAFEAARPLDSYAIIGRAIYAASNPVEAARRLAAEAQAFSDSPRKGQLS